MKGGEAAVETVKGPDSKETRIERMVNLYQLPLLRLCVMYLRDESQAKDAVQETFLKAYRNLDGFRGDASEKTWLTLHCDQHLQKHTQVGMVQVY